MPSSQVQPVPRLSQVSTLHNHPAWWRRAVLGGDRAVLARRTAVSIFVLSTPSLIIRSEILRHALYGKNFALELFRRAMESDPAVAGGGATVLILLIHRNILLQHLQSSEAARASAWTVDATVKI